MTPPIVSVVTGTYNRLDSVQRMVQSVRDNIPRGLPYDVILVDGGSSDGTILWASQQRDVKLIEHGALLGAMKAFCDGARASTADYIILANDDVAFKPNSILRAITYLEMNPTCAQVCFADNRYSLLHGDGTVYRASEVMATAPNGLQVSVPYGQVAMVRRELGTEALWWGDTDYLMKDARTYAGDNYLSAKLYEMGYTCDAVPGCEIQDFVQRDSLRQSNASAGAKDSALYYQRFPTIRLPAQRQSYPLRPRLRCLHLPIYEQAHPQALNPELGLTEALAQVGLALEIDWVNTETDWVEVVKAWQPDLLITQIQGPGHKITPWHLAMARNAAPHMAVVNFNGDVHLSGLTDPVVLDMLKYIDIQLVVNAAVLPEYERLGIRAAYWQIGVKEPVGELPDAPDYDLLFMGNCYNASRQMLVATLRYLSFSAKASLGVYGNCPDATGNSHYDFALQTALYQQATITVGDTFQGGYAYVSNRVFQALWSGAFLLQQVSDGLQEYTGLTPGVHYAPWTDIDDLATQVRYWLKPEQAQQRQRIASAGRQYVRQHFTYPAQVQKLFHDILPLLESEHANQPE